jgi:hypothetical protein
MLVGFDVVELCAADRAQADFLAVSESGAVLRAEGAAAVLAGV